MKAAIAIVACVLVAGAFMAAQAPQRPKPYKVVFDLTTDDRQDQTAVLRWIGEVASVNPENEIEVVMYGRGLGLVVSGRSTLADDVKQATGRPHVSFRVCEIALRNQKIDRSELLPNVTTVPDGIGEIVEKQRQGWGYIKAVAH